MGLISGRFPGRPWHRVTLVIAVLVAVIAGIFLANRTTSTPNYAAQDKEFAAQEKVLLKLQRQDAVAAAQDRVATAKARAALARRRLALHRRQQAALAAMRERGVHGVQMLSSLGFTPENLCAPIARGDKVRATRRRQILSVLNLSCAGYRRLP